MFASTIYHRCRTPSTPAFPSNALSPLALNAPAHLQIPQPHTANIATTAETVQPQYHDCAANATSLQSPASTGTIAMAGVVAIKSSVVKSAESVIRTTMFMNFLIETRVQISHAELTRPTKKGLRRTERRQNFGGTEMRNIRHLEAHQKSPDLGLKAEASIELSIMIKEAKNPSFGQMIFPAIGKYLQCFLRRQ